MLSGGILIIFCASLCFWLALIITAIVQIFKRTDFQINTKLLWTFLILFFPFIGLLIYLLANFKTAKYLFIALGIFVLLSAGITYYFGFVYSKDHKRNVEDEQAINVTAVKIVSDFLANEDSANKVYLNKAIAITGEVIEAKKNQDGKPTVTLKSNDSFSNIYCTLKEDAGQIQGGTTITVKGICTGYLSDVVIIDAIIVKQ
jgi:hypothetical protein